MLHTCNWMIFFLFEELQLLNA